MGNNIKIEVEDKITELVQLIREYQSSQDDVDAGEKSELGRIMSISDLEKVARDPKVQSTRNALSQLLMELPYDHQRELVAVALVGRGDFETYREAIEHCKTFDVKGSVNYLFGKMARLDNYLMEGIAKIRGITTKEIL